jgi:hypothetical protein
MRSLLIGMLLLAGVNVASADNKALVKCVVDGEKEGVSNKNCPAFDRALVCEAQLLAVYEDALNTAKQRVTEIKGELASARSPRRRELFAKAVREAELAVAAEEKAVAQSKQGDAILRKEKHDAACN